MADRNPVPSPVREDASARGRNAVRAETPPADYWRRWENQAPPGVAASAPAPVPAPAPATATPPPATPASPVPAATVLPELAAANDAPYRILIVEDDRSQALFAQSVLHGAGMHAQVEMVAANVQQAIGDYRPDLILMDLHMPDLDGMRLTALIRQQPQHQLLPIVFLTGDPDPERQFEVLDSGADDFLTKPIRPRHLVAAVSNRIRRARQQAQLQQPAPTRAAAASHPETGLSTRVHLMHRLGQLLDERMPGGAFFIEIASALGLRERFGYAAFERLMTQAGHRLATAAQSHALARLSDNSFLLLAPGMPDADMETFARDLRAHLAAQPFTVRDDEAVHLRCAIGFASLPGAFGDAGTVLEAVERTALQARLHSSGIQRHSPADERGNEDHLAWVAGQLELAYQPIVAVAGGGGAQYQVLLRLRQPDGTLLSAGQVIPAAEAAGRIADLDQQVLEHALGLLHTYQHATPPLRLFVSQSPRTLAREAFAEWLLQSIQQRAIQGTSLVIDVRLQDALIHAVTLERFCARLMPAGVQFCISQYEPGPEANALLGHLPLGYVRLANRFAGSHADTRMRGELREAIDLAHRRGLQIIGQQIEDAQAAAAMWVSGVDFIQGNLVQSVGQGLDFDFQNAVL
ncbi:EAL domain-containing protein [[Pseudomonas] boreopolis]|uniref:EAL domain-containing protein n=1 Tax=Xanthomonas boreopolis TaxID=86183 RepID=UPI003DA12574